jgi:hypothetical protein
LKQVNQIKEVNIFKEEFVPFSPASVFFVIIFPLFSMHLLFCNFIINFAILLFLFLGHGIPAIQACFSNQNPAKIFSPTAPYPPANASP